MAADEKDMMSSNMEKQPPSPVEMAHPPEKILKHAGDADEAMKAFAGYDGEVLVLDEATNRRLLRKIDLNLMPACSEDYLYRTELTL